KGSGAQESRPRAAILVPPETPVKTIVSGVDFVALDVLLGDRWLTCISIYIPVDTEPAEILERVSQEVLLSRRSEGIVAGADTNSASALWHSKTSQVPSRMRGRGETVELFLSKFDLEVINGNKETPSFQNARGD
ncbi:hypothetical protein Pmar_PMAR010856, partial [Perkinsus marinus ATCC 50983]